MNEKAGDLQALFRRIDALTAQKPRVLIAIDGMSGSGKTTLAAYLARVYGAGVLHMDDFFLQPHQRSAERLALPGGNVDHERFKQEVLDPLSRGEAFSYRPYVCCVQRLGEAVAFTPGRLTVVEGSYSLHPALEAAYDLKICLRIDDALQSARILARNGEAQHARFMREWVPLENVYFEGTKMDSRCDLILRVREQADGVSWQTEEKR